MMHDIVRYAASLVLIAGAAWGMDVRQVKVRFTVLADAVGTGETVYVTGNLPALGAWHPAGLALTRQDDGAWSAEIVTDPQLPLQYKITKGSWQTEALNADGTTPENSVIYCAADTNIERRVVRWREAVPASGVTGQVAYHRNLAGEGLLPRDLIVWLPPGYEQDPGGRFPVLYMHDGQNVFDPATSFLGIDWGVDETATRLIQEGTLQDLIVVGIYNTPDRFAEYGKDAEKTAAYIAFVTSTVKPLIDRTYRTRPEREHTAVMGSSMGGIISFLLAWRHPEIFSQAACLSPAFGFAGLLEDVEKHDGPDKNLRIYVDNGGVGMDRERLQPAIDRMLELLPKRGFERGRNFEWFLDEQAEHNEAAWAARVWRPLTFMFGLKHEVRDAVPE